MPNFEHVRWSRLPTVSPPRRTGRPPFPQPPLRSDPREHGRQLETANERSVSPIRQRREEQGVDPSRLLVLQLTVLESEVREYLETRLGLQVVGEELVYQEVQRPYVPVVIEFDNPIQLDNFIRRPDLLDIAPLGVRRFRKSTGLPSERRIYVDFENTDQRGAFLGRHAIHREAGFRVVFDNLGIVSYESRYRLIVQFPDRESLARFETELQAYISNAEARGALTFIQRRLLFDSLEGVVSLGPEDRMGDRLRNEGAPGNEKFYFDVDLWHPGSVAELAEARRQFVTVLGNTGGTITDFRQAANTLLLARVRGSKDTLDAVLSYDRVARVDLPPHLPQPEFTIFDPVTAPTEPFDVTDDMPLACVIDSGVVPGHPLLSGVVVGYNNVDSGEPDEVDQVGHGTHVAGIVTYGDIYKCIQDGQWGPQVRLLNAKVMRRGAWGFAEFAEAERAETQIEKAIRWGVRGAWLQGLQPVIR